MMPIAVIEAYLPLPYFTIFLITPQNTPLLGHFRLSPLFAGLYIEMLLLNSADTLHWLPLPLHVTPRLLRQFDVRRDDAVSGHAAMIRHAAFADYFADLLKADTRLLLTVSFARPILHSRRLHNSRRGRHCRITCRADACHARGHMLLRQLSLSLPLSFSMDMLQPLQAGADFLPSEAAGERLPWDGFSRVVIILIFATLFSLILIRFLHTEGFFDYFSCHSHFLLRHYTLPHYTIFSPLRHRWPLTILMLITIMATAATLAFRHDFLLHIVFRFHFFGR